MLKAIQKIHLVNKETNQYLQWEHLRHRLYGTHGRTPWTGDTQTCSVPSPHTSLHTLKIYKTTVGIINNPCTVQVCFWRQPAFSLDVLVKKPIPDGQKHLQIPKSEIGNCLNPLFYVIFIGSSKDWRNQWTLYCLLYNNNNVSAYKTLTLNLIQNNYISNISFVYAAYSTVIFCGQKKVSESNYVGEHEVLCKWLSKRVLKV